MKRQAKNRLDSKRVVLASVNFYSVYNFRLYLARKLKEMKYEVLIAAPEDEYRELLNQEFRTVIIKNLDRKSKNPFKDLKLLLEYLKLYSKYKPDLVINYSIKPNIYSSLACGLLKIRCISTLAGLGLLFVKKDLFQSIARLLYKAAFRFNTKVIFLNEEDMKEFVGKKIVKQNQAFILNGEGIDLNYFHPNHCNHMKKDNPNFIFLCITRLIWEKGIKEYVEAARILKKIKPDAEFWLLGPFDEGNPASVDEDYINSATKEGIINYLGAHKDVRPFICCADAVVLPSFYREGVPRALLEAMALEKPIITTTIPGCKEVCKDSFNGFCVKPKDVNGLVEAMIRLMELPQAKRIEMGKYGRRLAVEKFENSVVYRDLLQLISNTLGAQLVD
ncbi:MAG: glycosyltransferase family 4 protein [candidate division WOR-3 bacterium]